MLSVLALEAHSTVICHPALMRVEERSLAQLGYLIKYKP